MELTLAALFFAFCGGAFGALIGALPNFILCGFALAAAIASGLAGADVDYSGLVVWGSVLGPHIGFVGGAAATVYAKKIGVLGSGKDIGAALVGLRRPSVILVGGAFGALGYLVNMGLNNVVPGKLNSIAMTITITALISKMLFDQVNVLGTVPEEVKQAGGRYSARCRQVWIAECRTPIELTLTGIVVGGLSACVAIEFAKSPTSAPMATSVGFAIAVMSLLFIMLGVKIPVTHHIALTAAVAATASGSNLWWGLVFGVVAAFAAHYLAQAFMVFGETWIDPPSVAIAVLSVFTFWVFPTLGLFETGPWIPGVVLVVLVVWSSVSHLRTRAVVEAVEVAPAQV